MKFTDVVVADSTKFTVTNRRAREVPSKDV